MGTLYKRENRTPNWQATYPRADGTRAWKSTGTSIKRDAEAILHEWEKAERKARKAASASQSEMAEILVRAVGQANRGELTLDRANQCLMQIYEIASGEEYPNYTVAEWFNQWLTNAKPSISQKTIERYENSIREVLQALGSGADKQIQLLSIEDLRDVQHRFLKEAKIKGTKTATVNFKVQDAKAAIRSAYEQGLISRDIGAAIKALPTEDSKISASFTADEISTLIVHAKGDWKGAILIAAHTGLRLSNVSELRWGEIDLAAGKMVVCPVKQKRKAKKKTVTIPLSQSVEVYLNHLIPHQTGLVFPTLSGKASSTLSNQFGVLMKRADIPRQVCMPGGETGSRSFHSLRHSYISFMANAQVPAEVRRSLAAHDSAAVHEGYTHHDHETLKRAVDSLPTMQVA